MAKILTVPVIAVGGVAHHQDIQALLALGATAVLLHLW
ncbi:MAG: nitronate monooxygenase [Marinomonadaceae bacterium]